MTTRKSPRPAPFVAEASWTLKACDGRNEIPLFDSYVDRYWTPVVGAAVIALVRFVAVEDGHDWTAGDIAQAVGIGRSMPRLARLIDRATAHRFMVVRPHSLAGLTTVPRLRANQVALLPSKLRGEMTTGRVV